MKVKLDFKTKKTLRSQNKSEIDFEKSDNKLSNIKRKECKRIQEYRKQLKSDPTLAERAKKLQAEKSVMAKFLTTPFDTYLENMKLGWDIRRSCHSSSTEYHAKS